MSSYIYALVILTALFIVNTLGPVVTNIDLRIYDSILHLLGGLGLGFFLSGLAASLASLKLRKRSYIVLGVFLCGIAWELFEVYYNIAGYKLWTTPYYLDTLKDLVFDIIGGTIVAYLVIKKDVK